MVYCCLGPRNVFNEVFSNSIFVPLLLPDSSGISGTTLHLAYQSVSLSKEQDINRNAIDFIENFNQHIVLQYALEV